MQKKGFVAQKHDGIPNLLATLISKVCKNVEIDPHLQPLDNERFNHRSTVTSSDDRLDINAGRFWSRGVTALFDVRVTHVNSKSNQGKSTPSIFQDQENEKKRKYQQRILDVEIYTPRTRNQRWIENIITIIIIVCFRTAPIYSFSRIGKKSRHLGTPRTL